MSSPSFVMTQPPQHKYKARLYPRKYPILKALVIVFYCLAVLVAINLVLSLSVVFTGAAAMLSSGSRGNAGMLSAVVGLIVILFHAAWIACLLLPAEFIKLCMDVQANTQEAAHYAKHGQA